MVMRGQRWRIEGEDHHGRYSRSTKGRKGAGDIGQQRNSDHSIMIINSCNSRAHQQFSRDASWIPRYTVL